ncbi:PRTRC system ThiF family protein [Edaphobacter modestus]|uniref:PRTRC genetic system ThiF family protein n=1 Tax=Edaphobacter modestus TaxID=388466 RepID=A0A4Q7Y074_9BACT|nr:PRTRC system ThiF family protein [Edaphobacter modestus]RZU28939.1 PRTRC genetic system ThiF family protein [Edaphobacter modestus]
MKITHQLSNDGSVSGRAIRVLLIGSGGNGSTVLFGLPYLHHALVAWGKPDGLDVTVMDADTVSPTNCVRQPFGAADIGQNKATTLVNRVNMFHGFQWKSQEEFFSKTKASSLSSYDRTIDLVISCVDTRSARLEMHEAFNNATGPWRCVRYWCDLGNNASNGQFVLGQPLNAINRRSRVRLRTVTELFPSIMDTSLGEGSQPSCSAADALQKQEPFVNNVLATSALAMVTRLLRYGTLDHHGAFYNAATGRTVPMPIDPDMWEKQSRRRRRMGRRRNVTGLA